MHSIRDGESSMQATAVRPLLSGLESIVISRGSVVRAAIAGTVILAASAVSAAPTFVDLNVVDFTATVQGHSVTYAATVQNSGTAKAGKFLVEVHPNAAVAPEPTKRMFPSAWVTAGLLPGQSTVVTLPAVPRANGTHTSWLVVDGLDLVVETDEANNVVGPKTVTVSAPAPQTPELYVSDLGLKYEGSKVTLVTTVYNAGASTATPFRTNVVFDAPNRDEPRYIIPPGEGFNFDHQQGLAGGATRLLSFPWEGVPDGIHTAWIWVDTPYEGAGTVVEADEENNLLGPIVVSVNVQPDANDQPDLALDGFRATAAGTSVTYEIDVTNNGGVPTGPYTAGVVVDSATAPTIGGATGPEVLAVDDAVGLEVGESRTLTKKVEGLDYGSYTSWALLDPYDAIVELNETNNDGGPAAFEIVAAAGVDLVLEGFKVKVVDGAVGYQVTVRNAGTAPSGTFDVDIYTDLPEAPTAGTAGDQGKTVENLAPSEATQLTFTFADAAPGAYVSWMMVDPQQEVSETDESNNVAGPRAFTVDAGKAACTDGALITEECLCGGVLATVGYCCDGAADKDPCPGGAGDSDVTTGSDAATGDDIAIIPDFQDDVDGGDDGGCSHTSPVGGSAMALALLGVLLVARRRVRG